MEQDLSQLLRSVVKTELTPVVEQVVQIGQRLGQLDQRFDQVDQRLDQVDRRLDQMDQRFDQVDQRLDQMDQRLDQMDQRLVRVEDDQQLIKQAVLETNERVIRMESLLTNQHQIIELLSVRSIEQEAQLKRIS